jgi:hypothetical protein
MHVRNAHKIVVENPEGKRLLGDIGTVEGMILKWMLEFIGCESVHWIHLAQEGVQKPVLENMVLDSTKDWKFLDWLSDYKLLKDCVP